MKTTINIKNIDAKISKSGKNYAVVLTEEEGALTCFEENIIKSLEGKQTATVEIVESKGFKNLRQIYDDEVITEEVKIIPELDPKKTDKFADARAEKNKAFYTSYAKDIFLGLVIDSAVTQEKKNYADLMKLSVDLVKMASEEF